MRLEYDREVDAVYIYLSDAPYAYGKDIDKERHIDYDINDAPIGIELLCVSDGVALDSLPYSEEIAKMLEGSHIRVYA